MRHTAVCDLCKAGPGHDELEPVLCTDLQNLGERIDVIGFSEEELRSLLEPEPRASVEMAVLRHRRNSETHSISQSTAAVTCLLRMPEILGSEKYLPMA